jgi:two-component system cell cycle sensor histidine kinase/response regulator CckA
MQLLLMNLVINGAEAIGDRPGTVTVATGRIDVDEPYLRTMLLQTQIAPGPYVFAEVQDTGIGMDEQTIAKIFDPFFTTKFTGRGLGLAAAVPTRRKASENDPFQTPEHDGAGSAFLRTRACLRNCPTTALLPTRRSPPQVDRLHVDFLGP